MASINYRINVGGYNYILDTTNPISLPSQSIPIYVPQSSSTVEIDIQKIKAEEDSWRRRVGSYRVFYEIISVENLIYVYEVKRRTSNTY